MSDYYRLEDHIPVPCTLHEWAKLTFEERTVARTMIYGYEVLTLFHGIDPYALPSTPVSELRLFGTAIRSVDGERFDEERLYMNWADATAGHAQIVAFIVGTKKWGV